MRSGLVVLHESSGLLAAECLLLHMPADAVLETPDDSCLPAEMDYGETITKIRLGS